MVEKLIIRNHPKSRLKNGWIIMSYFCLIHVLPVRALVIALSFLADTADGEATSLIHTNASNFGLFRHHNYSKHHSYVPINKTKTIVKINVSIATK